MRRALALAVMALLAACSEGAAGSGPPATAPEARTQQGPAWLNESANVKVVRGNRPIDKPRVPQGTVFDLRSWSFHGRSGYPLTFGEDWSPVSRVVTVGGSVSSTLPDRSWNYLYHVNRQDGDGIRVVTNDWTATYGLTLHNVWDGYNPTVEEGSEPDNNARFLLSGCYFKWIHDDAVENDSLMSGTVRDCLFDDIFVGFSEAPSDGYDYTNHGSVLKVRDVIARFSPSIYDGRSGTGMLFKWDDAAGSVDMRRSVFLFDDNTNQEQGSQRFPRGTYKDVTIVLGPDFEGSWPVPLPPGVKVTRDMSIFTGARDAWLDRHGVTGQATPPGRR